jgi:hypothetical protein
VGRAEEKHGRTGFPERFPQGTGKPRSNCRRVAGTQGGRIGPGVQKWGLQAISRDSIFPHWREALGIEIATGKNQHCRSGKMVFQTPLYKSLIYGAVQGTDCCRCIRV